MALADLKGTRQDDPELDDFADYDYVRPYVHSVFYDATHFRTEAERDALMQMVPADQRDRHWRVCATTVEKLPATMKFYGANHADQFRQRGFVVETAEPQPQTGRPPRSALSELAWDAFRVNAVTAEAIVYAWQKLRGENAGGLIFPDLKANLFSPILGRANGGDRTRGTTILAEYQGILVAPRTFTAPCTAYPAEPIVWDSSVTDGRHRDRWQSWTSDKRSIFRRRTTHEIRAWSDYLGDEFSIDGVALSVAQRLALLRVQATDWRFREKTGYVMSGTPEFAHDERACETKEEYVRQELQTISNDLEPPGNPPPDFVMPALERFPNSLLLDVHSFLTGGIGLQHQAFVRSEPYHLSLAYREIALTRFAKWISELKRFHKARLTKTTAQFIRRVMVNERNEVAELDLRASDWSRTEVIRAQFPDAVWNELLAVAEQLRHDQSVEISYRWNDNPVDPVRIEHNGQDIVIFGPLLPINAQSQRWWAQRAELFRERRSLTM